MDSDNDTYKMLTVLNGGGASTCTVNGLMKYQLYEFFIVPFYKTVEGKPSNSRMARTLEDGKFNYSVFVPFFFCSDFACIWKSDDFIQLNREKKTTFSGSLRENRLFYRIEMDMKQMGNIRSLLEFECFDCSDELCKKNLWHSVRLSCFQCSNCSQN